MAIVGSRGLKQLESVDVIASEAKHYAAAHSVQIARVN